ncbi:hypothetical protein DL768_004887 [Monosporascus sp. mg162]|nr:hypothetical protein DL768_004887 [Monosporascus sp. mg162]
MSHVDVLIIGGGPSGLSAALTLARQNHTVVLFDTSEGRASASPRIHGFSCWDHKAPEEYLEFARNELKPYKCFTAVDVHVAKLATINTHFKATDKNGATYEGKKVILANGVVDVFPDVLGYADCWGKGIFHNLFAQAYQEDIANIQAGVLAVDWIAMPQFTIHMTHLASQLASSVTIYTNGNEELAKEIAPTLEGKPWKSDTRKIARLRLKSPNETAVEITFEDGSTTLEAFVAHNPMTKVRGPFAQQLGIKLVATGGQYETSGPFNATSVPGIFAVGDTTNMFKVWPNAVASGAQAAAGIAIMLQEEKWGLPTIYR